MHRGLYILRDNVLRKTNVKNVSDCVEVDCQNKVIYAGEFNRSLFRKINGKNGLVMKVYKTRKFKGASRLRYDRNLNSIFSSRDNISKIMRFDLGSEKIHFTKFDHYVVDFHFAPEIDALYTLTWGGKMYRYNSETMEKEGALWIPDLLIHLDMDKENLVAYITAFFKGEIYKVNLATMEIISRAKFAPGLRFPLYDKKRNVLFVSNFITGHCLMIDADNLQIIKKRYFGKRLRVTSLSKNGNTLYAASAAGGYKWDLDDE